MEVRNCRRKREKLRGKSGFVTDHCRLYHIYRERNVVADTLAKGSIHDAAGLHILTDPPTHIDQVLKDDCAGTGRTRTPNSVCNS